MTSALFARILFPVLIFLGFLRPLAHGAEAEEEKTVSTLKGLIILNSQDAVLKEGDPALSADGLQVKDVEFLEGGDFAKAMQPFFGRTVDGELLKEIQVAIRNYYWRNGLPLVDPVFPPQTVMGGVLQLVVIEAKLGKVVFEGTNKWTRTEHVRKTLCVKEGEPINENKLMSDLNWLNRNRFRSVDALYKPGEGRFESDLVIRTADRFPLGSSFGIDNTGNPLLGEGRMSFGVDWGKAFGFNDNLFSYRFVTDTDFELLRAHMASYTVFLPWRHTLTLSGSYADVKANIPNLPITQEGASYQANLRYGLALPNLPPTGTNSL